MILKDNANWASSIGTALPLFPSAPGRRLLPCASVSHLEQLVVVRGERR